MKLAIFGATGTVGGALLTQALDAGHQVRALARTPSKINRTDPSLTVVPVDAKDPEAVRTTLTGCEAVLSTLGGPADPDSISVGTATVMSAMRSGGISRFIIMQGFHLGFPGDADNFGRKAILPVLWLMSHDLIRDSRAMATTVRSSDLDWTVVRAPRVVVGSRTGSYRTGVLKLGPWDSVTNADVADFMLRCLLDATTVPHGADGGGRWRAARDAGLTAVPSDQN